MKIIIGIDNGVDGAIVGLSPDGKVLLKQVMPIIGVKGKGRRAYDIADMARLVKTCGISHAFLEAAGPRPIQGVSAAFGTGLCFGVWQGVLSALKIPYTIVRPQEWQREMFKGMNKGDTKRASALVAARLAPDEDWRASERCRKPHDGLTDAYGIAEYGRRTLFIKK